MPKNVDHQQRRDDIAQATFELIARNGLMNASVRAVADYSGYSAGSIRHYFPVHDELLRYVSSYLTRQIGNRISAIAQDEKLTVRQRVEQACEQLLPLDAMRKREIVAYAELGRLERARPTGRLEEGQGIAAQEIIYPSYINPADIQEELRQTLDDIEREIADLIPQK